MGEAQLRQAFEAEKPSLAAWGNFVTERLLQGLEGELSINRPIRYFLKIWPVVPRVKDSKSFIEKALWGKKRYSNPLAEITDKVGVRFVVLLLEEIRLIERLIVASDCWVAELSRDFVQERQAMPLHFDYQSLHYVVRAARDLDHEGMIVPKATPCEIQVRTLLQHAYSELTHDTLYKPKSALEPEDPTLSRQVARSMALIETSDLIFQQVADAIEKTSKLLTSALVAADAVYRRKIGTSRSVETRLAEYILSPFRNSLPLITETGLEQVLEEHEHLVEFIRNKAKSSVFFESGLALIVIWLVVDDEDAIWRNWPVDRKVLEEIFTELGISFERY